MVILNKIYTKTGDDGTTGLANGERRLKSDLRIEAYGLVDEANACIGMSLAHFDQKKSEMFETLKRMQNDLFDLGADLSMPEVDSNLSKKKHLRITNKHVSRLEKDIDIFNKELQPLRSFILPGGTLAASALHLARTVMRNAERRIVELVRSSEEDVNPAVIQYVNRASDFLFVAARWVNGRGKSDILWVPGKNS